MNYIKRLQKDNADLLEQLGEYQDMVYELNRYLDLPKFKEDTTVQVQDVRNRLYLMGAIK